MEPLKTFIQKRVRLSAHDWSLIKSKFTQVTLSEGKHLLMQGQICRHLYFLESGTVRMYTKKLSKESTNRLILGPRLFTSTHSFGNQRPAHESIVCLTPCKVWGITLKDHQALFSEVAVWNKFVREIIQEGQSANNDLGYLPSDLARNQLPSLTSQ